MAIFSIVFFKVVAVLLNVIIGFLAGRFAKVERDSIASLLFYFIAPIVFFGIPSSTAMSVSSIGVMFVTFAISTILCFASYKLYSHYWQDDTRNILALSAGDGNSGYFMLPIATALFDDYTLSMYMMAVVGMNIYESSVGYYMCAKSVVSTRDSIMKVIKLPMLNAFVAGCLCSFAGITLPDFLDDFMHGMRSAFSILGMIMIGLGLSTIPKFEIDIKFTSACLISKFVFYPVAVNIFIAFDKILFGFYDDSVYDALQLVSFVPLAANTIVFASIWKLNPERMAATVLISSVLALLYIPTMASFFIRSLE